eukprot:CAMPEP_0119018166 /NCGR_PEP_ID=MMETSP1176-20130426/18749_1 /TAXON_ID=265551 /ORGANISM="Synedropsis recta cf, Strain CCMP1620" /LENGTH=307 /DNA_ID=CAMNT_0006972111 /DNA_START=89 /DNA_END=1012 /DNA_ORIENTATION=-
MGGSKDKEGHICCFCLCDVRRAVVIINILNLIGLLLFLAFYSYAVTIYEFDSQPSAMPSYVPTTSQVPTLAPSFLPSDSPSPPPTAVGSAIPSATPSVPPPSPAPVETSAPSELPVPSAAPSSSPATVETSVPSVATSLVPSFTPSFAISETGPRYLLEDDSLPIDKYEFTLSDMSAKGDNSTHSNNSTNTTATTLELFGGKAPDGIFDTSYLGLDYIYVAIIYGTLLLGYVIAIFGALTYSSMLVGIGMLAHIFEMCSAFYHGAYFGGLFILLYIYPHVTLILEIRKGVMEKDTYYDRERQSICCV